MGLRSGGLELRSQWVRKSISVLYLDCTGTGRLGAAQAMTLEEPVYADCYDGGVMAPAPETTLRTVFLDRDGILNEKRPEGEYVTRWEEFRVLPGVPEALRRLNDAGLRVVVVSNQRGIARGLYRAADVDAMHTEFQRLLARRGAHIDAFFICPHEKGECNCRKPLPGLFEQAAARFPAITAATSAMVGDSLSDIEFGRNLGMVTIFIQGRGKTPRAEGAAELADLRCASLAEAVEALLAASFGERVHP
jgi:D-glycero-D-manno-heptose 1,7-bisphosphate phosphatase